MADLKSYFQGYDLDSGGGTDYVLGVNLRLTASGGSAEALGQKTMASSLPVVLASDQSALAVDTELPAAAALADNTSNPTVPGVGAFAMVFDGSTWDRLAGNSAGGVFTQGPAAHDAAAAGSPLLLGGYASAAAPSDVSADGDAVRAWRLRNGAAATVITAAGALVGGDATNGLDVDVTRVQGTVTVDTELLAVAALADAVANPSPTSLGAYMIGFNGTTWDRVRTANTGRLQVDVITGGGVDTPTNPVVNTPSAATITAGSTTALNSSEAAAKKLRKVVVWGSAAYKATLHTVDNAVESGVKATGGGQPFTAWEFSTPHRNYITLGTTAGADNFRVNVTNLDDANSADFYASFFYED